MDNIQEPMEHRVLSDVEILCEGFRCDDIDEEIPEVVIENLPPSDIDDETDTTLLDNDRKSLTRHNDQYSELLEIYVNNAERTLDFKHYKKYDLYGAVIFLLTGVPIMMCVVLFVCLGVTAFNPDVEMVSILPEILAAFGTLVATYIAIVKLITGYLFNTNEEETMKDIIFKIQDYDMELRGNKKKQRNNDSKK